MSAWSKSVKPVITGVSASEIFMVDEAEVAATPGITQPGDTVKGFLTTDEVVGVVKKMYLITGAEAEQN